MKIICAWCSRATDGNNDAIGDKIKDHSKDPNVSHGICNACRNAVRIGKNDIATCARIDK